MAVKSNTSKSGKKQGNGFKDITGQRFGRLLVLEKVGRTKNYIVIWKCRCDCGNIVSVRGTNLRGGTAKSCGCLRKEKRAIIDECGYGKDETGKRYGRLLVMKVAGRAKNRSVLWECVCDCGNTVIVMSANLRRKNTQSCGCLQKDKIIEINTTHGMHDTLLYAIWGSMKQRCKNPNDKSYKNYGGRGIKVCSRWLKFENFYADMGEKPGINYTIERIDNDKNYCPENCKWDTRANQSHNKRMVKRNRTGFAGIDWHKGMQKYRVRIGINYKEISLGCFANINDAIQARKDGEAKYWTEE